MNIRKLITQGESETVEFKQSFNKQEISETLSAMANRNGGVILIGVTNNGEVKGVQLGKETLQEWLNQIGQTTEPRLIPSLLEFKTKGKSVVAIEIAPYPIKPVSCNGRCYLRVTSSNKQLNAKEIADLHLQTTHNSWDTFLAADVELSDINLNFVKQFFARIKLSGRRNLAGTGSIIETLQKLKLLAKGKVTWAAFLLFKKNRHALPATAIRIVRFKGDTTIIDDNFIEQPLFNIIEPTIAAIRKNLRVQYIITGKPQRDEIWEYPLDAIREAVVNAICHRDYVHNADIQIKIFDDHMSIWNPGKLPYNITIKDLLNNEHSSNPRNKLIAQAFYDMGEVERIGSGIKRIMDACEKSKLPMPEIKEAEGGFYVIFRRPKENIYNPSFENAVSLNEPFTKHYNTPEPLKNRQVEVINYVKKHSRITNSEYQALFNVSHRTAARELSDLITKNILNRVGVTGKGTFYVLKNTNVP
ncbi:MAG: putative DNA binding domain-containing protein [Bacteroidetes bacterium]|nr:putative DNA binding domain-containing protein [Bacteroidota bacterium]